MNKEVQILKEMPVRIPVNGTFELTVRCNLHCKMCLFRHDDSENAEIMAKELTTEQWIDMARQAAEAGTMSLLITGGEPMLRPDFCEIWEGIYKRGFIITLYTNATLVTPKIMETLRKYPPHKIGVTIYGASAATYEKVCGNGDAFGRCIEGIEQLMTLPSKMEFRTTIIKDNYHDVDAIETLVHDNYGKERTLIQTRLVTAAVRGACADVKSCRLDPEDNIKLAFRRGINILKECIGSDYDNSNVHYKWEKKQDIGTQVNKMTLLGCDAGMRDYTISWQGKLLGCQLLGAFETDALQLGIIKAWEKYPESISPIIMNEKCVQCQNKYLCNACVATIFAETGKIDGCPECFCEDADVMNRMLDKED